MKQILSILLYSLLHSLNRMVFPNLPHKSRLNPLDLRLRMQGEGFFILLTVPKVSRFNLTLLRQ